MNRYVFIWFGLYITRERGSSTSQPHTPEEYYSAFFEHKFFEGGRVVRWCWVNFQCRGVLLLRKIVGQGPTALAVGAGGSCLDIFTLDYRSLFFLPLSGKRPDID